MLKDLGYAVTSIASPGEDAVAKAESTFPDLCCYGHYVKRRCGRRGDC